MDELFTQLKEGREIPVEIKKAGDVWPNSKGQTEHSNCHAMSFYVYIHPSYHSISKIKCKVIKIHSDHWHFFPDGHLTYSSVESQRDPIYLSAVPLKQPGFVAGIGPF